MTTIATYSCGFFSRLLHTLLVLFAMPLAASAATLAYYDIESNLTVSDTTEAVGLTASNLDVTSASGTSANYKWVGSRVPYWFTDNPALNEGTDPGVSDIVGTFSLTPDSGQQIVLNQTGAFDFGVLAFQNSNVGEGKEGNDYLAHVRLFVASDSSFLNILATSTILSDGKANGQETATLGTVDLDNLVASSSTLYFGIAMVDDTSNNVANSINARFDGVRVNGEITAVPEPSAVLLMSLGTLLLLRRRRSHHS